MKIIDLGLMPYGDALEVQKQHVQDVSAGEEEKILIVEHPPVITLGKNAGKEHLHVSEALLVEQGIGLFKTTRGGDITCHFPGQLVVYPILRVHRADGGMRGIFHKLEDVAIKLSAHYGVEAGRREGFPGVWIENRKICSIGLAAKRWTTYHGLAFNVLPDVSLFNAITLCGLDDAIPTSLSLESGSTSITMEEIKKVSTSIIKKIF